MVLLLGAVRMFPLGAKFGDAVEEIQNAGVKHLYIASDWNLLVQNPLFEKT